MDGLGINEITEDAHKLTFLRSHAGAELFSLLEGATDFDTAIGILDAQFETPTRVLFARHNLLSCKQKPEENVNDFVKRLKILVQRCECVDISADEHKNLLLRDALLLTAFTPTRYVFGYWNWKITKLNCPTASQ